jgi:hypothetical protein
MQVKPNTFGVIITPDPGEKLIDCPADQVTELLRTKWAIYFTGFQASIEDFDAFARKFGRSAPPRRMPPNPGDLALGFHAEDAYNAWRPDALWFLCLAVGSDGGSPTDVLDGVQLLNNLDPKWNKFSLDNTVCYNQTWTAGEWRQALEVGTQAGIEEFLDSLHGLTYEFSEDGSLRTRFETPIAVTTYSGDRSFSNTMLHAQVQQDFYGMSLADGSPVPPEFLAHVEEVALASLAPLGWSEGDVAVIDNCRLMHRRGVYLGTGRDIRVIHGEEFLGSKMPDTSTPVAAKMKEVLQGELELR